MVQELSNEEKVKRYDEIAKEVKDFFDGKQKMCSDVTKALEDLFPELVESKDEKIREGLLNSFREMSDGSEAYYSGLRVKDIISWLEKQGNDKPSIRERYNKMTESEWFKKIYEDKSCGIDNESVNNSNKVKPKFHIGEWIIFNGSVLYINEVVQGYYRTISRDSIYNSYDWNIDYAARPWTIEEAKDGDILTSHECYVIFKEIDGLNIRCYCTFYLNVGSIPMFHVNTLQNKTAFCPVVKEERELFLKKVNEFGYRWDSENKKLIKI